LEKLTTDLVPYEGRMRDDLQLVQKTEGSHVRHAFLMPPAATAERISTLFFRATAAV
jgi:hypothetical protein